MKNITTIKTLIAALTFSSTCYAQSGVGGGDQCKNEINRHRIAIQKWILQDEAKDLDFSKAKVKGLTYENYKKNMLSALEDGKVVVRCLNKEVTIGTPAIPVTCINYEDKSGVSHIDCNYDLVMSKNSIGNPDFQTTHHEFASIAGIEERTGTYDSDFTVSDQLAQFEHTETVMLLGPKKATMMANAAQPSHYDVLKDKYLNGTSNSITQSQLEGAYLGVCYSKYSPDSSNRVVLSTLMMKNTSIKDANQGPDFPPITTTTTTWKMSEYDSPSYIDNFSFKDDMFWDPNDDGTVRTDIPDMTLENGTAISLNSSSATAADKFTYKVKIGNDGLFYGLLEGANDTDSSPNQFCYFYKKLDIPRSVNGGES